MSRYIFANWFSLLIKYFLIKYFLIGLGFDIKLRAKINNCIIEIDVETYELLISMYSIGLIYAIECIEGKLRVNDSWHYDYAINCWVKEGVKFKRLHGVIFEVFDYGEYSALDVTDKIIVDVGAGYGETALYFLKRGARRVIAVEPCPEVYREMLENLRLNGVEDKVAPLNAALSSAHGSACIECPSGKVTVGTITLGDIIDRFGLHGGVLKMDCEGCEYDVILNDYEHVRLFDVVYFEYHAYITKIPVQVLLEKLSEDFKCEIVSNKEFYRRHGFSEKLLGLVRCVKK